MITTWRLSCAGAAGGTGENRASKGRLEGVSLYEGWGLPDLSLRASIWPRSVQVPNTKRPGPEPSGQGGLSITLCTCLISRECRRVASSKRPVPLFILILYLSQGGKGIHPVFSRFPSFISGLQHPPKRGTRIHLQSNNRQAVPVYRVYNMP